jgi:hypothetical protein
MSGRYDELPAKIKNLISKDLARQLERQILIRDSHKDRFAYWKSSVNEKGKY